MDECSIVLSEDLMQKHRREKKELQGKLQALKKSATKGDKKKKREVMEEIARLESELDKKQQDELDELSVSNANVLKVTDKLNNLSMGEGVGIACELDGLDDPPGLTQHRLTKAQRRRDKKATHLKARDLRISEQEILNIYGVRNVETKTIKEILKERNLMIHEIPSDGNCLYCAVEHQLKETKSSTAPGLRELRVRTSEFLRKNIVDFLPFLSHPDTGEMLTEQQFTEYCDMVAHTPAWGGEIELKALSQVLRCRIEVIQANGPVIVVGDEYKDGPQITLTYHRHMYSLGDHYNSVKPYQEQEEEQMEDDVPS